MQTTLRTRDLSTRLRRVSFRRDWLILLLATWVAWWAGSAVATGGSRRVLAIALAAGALGMPLLVAVITPRVKPGFAGVELPALLILIAELVLRRRDAEQLASNPLDIAGLYRVGCIGLALLLGLLGLVSSVSRVRERITTRPFRLYCLYVFVVFIGAPLSINLLLTTYRGVELLAGIVVLAGAYRRVGAESAERILSVIFWFSVVGAVPIWLEALIMPGSAFVHVDSPFPIQLHGVFPAVSANGTGLTGATIGLWSLAKLLSPRDRGAASTRTLKVLAVLGFATLLLAQYRTGFIATAVALVVLLSLRARAAAVWVVVVGIIVAAAWGAQIGQSFAPVWQRGENAEVLRNLSGRLDWWSAALPVWKESPLFGRGLLTGTRFEVLAKIGQGRVSTIHGTWIEALVGTGLVGLGLLAASVLIATARALREAIRPDGRVVPLVLLTILLIRSVTGPTFEVAGPASVQLLAIALLLRDPSPIWSRDRSSRASLHVGS
jgi:O-antigen ligase